MVGLGTAQQTLLLAIVSRPSRFIFLIAVLSLTLLSGEAALYKLHSVEFITFACFVLEEISLCLSVSLHLVEETGLAAEQRRHTDHCQDE